MLATEPARIAMHIAAEFATAVALIIGGWGLLKTKPSGKQIYLLATGALLYTMLQSPGYFFQNNESGFVIMVALLIVIALALLILIFKKG